MKPLDVSMITNYPPTEQKNMEINQKIYNRNIPDAPIDPVYSTLPLSTRGIVFPISVINPVQQSKLPLSSFTSSNIPIENAFRPYQCNAPVIDYMKNIQLENSLRNQYFALQSGPKPVYVPSSSSDLFNAPQYLATPNVSPSVPTTRIPDYLQKYNIGNMVFNNATKIQVPLHSPINRSSHN